MKILTKRILYSLFILFFIIASPLVILHAFGYRFNLKKIKFEKTGSLIVETVPKYAQVLLNKKSVAEKTPIKLYSLFPDEYSLEIQKPGYYPWKNIIKIKSGLVTFVKNLYLVRQGVFGILQSGAFISLKDVPEENKVLLIIDSKTGKELQLYNTDENILKNILTFPSSSQLQLLKWSNNNKKILLSWKNNENHEFFIINTETLDTINITKKTHKQFEKIQWQSQANTILLGLLSNVLYEINLAGLTLKPVLSDRIDDFSADDKAVYYTTRIGEESFLKKKTLNGDSAEELVKLPKNLSYAITLFHKDMIALSDAEHNLFIIKTDIFKSNNKTDFEKNIVFQDKAKDIVWSKDKKKFLYYNDFELWSYDALNNSKNLIDRLSAPIQKATWCLYESLIAYQVGNSIFLTYENQDNKKNTIELLRADSIINFWVDKTGTILYFGGKFNNNEGIFQYKLTEKRLLPFSALKLTLQAGSGTTPRNRSTSLSISHSSSPLF